MLALACEDWMLLRQHDLQEAEALAVPSQHKAAAAALADGCQMGQQGSSTVNMSN